MNKTKNPWLAVFFSIIYLGAGQIYAGRIYRGLAFAAVNLAGLIFFFFKFYSSYPEPIKAYCIFVFLLFRIFIIIDSYLCVVTFNTKHHETRVLPNSLKAILIVIVFLISISGMYCGRYFNSPIDIANYWIESFIKKNYFDTFEMNSNLMAPDILPGDLILVDTSIYKRKNPKRGDLVIFHRSFMMGGRMPIDIQRIFAIPHDKLEMKGNYFYINGMPAKNPGLFSKHDKNKSLELLQNEYLIVQNNGECAVRPFISRVFILGKVTKIYYPFNHAGPIMETGTH